MTESKNSIYPTRTLLKIMVCGPIGGVGIERILRMRKFLERKGFETVKQFSGGSDYSHISDFRKRTRLAKKIIKHDFVCVKEADVLVVLSGPSSGASIEMYVAKGMKKKVILVSDKPVSSPWPINFSDHTVTSRKELVKKLQNIM